MKNKFKPLLLTLVLTALLFSTCKKPYSPPVYLEKPGYEYIYQLGVSGDELWIISSSPNLYESYLPIIPQYHVSVHSLITDEFMMNDKIPAVTTFTFDKNKKPFLATFDKRILKLNEDLSYEQYLVIPGIHSIEKTLFDQNNVLWIGTYSGGLFLFDGTDTTRFSPSNSILNSSSVQSIAMDSESNIWLIQGTELFKIDKNRIISKDPILFPINNQSGTSFLSADRNNTLWVYKWDGNFHRIYKKSTGGPWTEIEPPSSSDKRPVKFIKSDDRGTIWIAYSDYPKDVLAYYDTDRWVEVKFPQDEVIVTDVVVYNDEIIVGTSRGICIIPSK